MIDNIAALMVFRLRKLVESALKAYNLERSIYLPEIARTTFLKAILKLHQGKAEDAKELRREAASLGERFADVLPIDVDALEEGDFDELVTFWSR